MPPGDECDHARSWLWPESARKGSAETPTAKTETPKEKTTRTGFGREPSGEKHWRHCLALDQETDEWQQILWVDPSKPPQLKDLGPATGKHRSMREWVDNEMTKNDTHRKQEEIIRKRAPKLAKLDLQRRDQLDKVALVRARLYAK